MVGVQASSLVEICHWQERCKYDFMDTYSLIDVTQSFNQGEQLVR